MKGESYKLHMEASSLYGLSSSEALDHTQSNIYLRTDCHYSEPGKKPCEGKTEGITWFKCLPLLTGLDNV